MGKAPCCSKVGLRKGPWSTKEDTLLTNYIQEHGEGQWRSMPKKAGLLRCGKSCRLRWKNYLRPDIKRGNITPDEDDLIIRLHSLLGNRWSLIAGRLPDRTDNEIKNHWNTHLAKRLKNVEAKSKPTKKVANTSKESKDNKNCSSDDSSNESADKKIEVYTPKAIRVLPGFANKNTSECSLSNSSSSEEVEIKEEAKIAEFTYFDSSEASRIAWPLNEIGDTNYYQANNEVDEDDDQAILDGCYFSVQDFWVQNVSLEDSGPMFSDMLGTVYDEYLQLL